MNKVDFKGSVVLNPVPVVLITSRNKSGKDNVFTVGWTGTICTKPPMLSISIRPERLSYEYICETMEFIVNMPSSEMVKAVDYCGVKPGRKFDKILVDVPCSGYGVIRKKPEILYTKNRENIEELASLQLEILNSAADILKDGGELIYSTCTIISQENTENVEKFLNERKEFKVKALNIPENVSGEYDKLGGFSINYKEEIMDNFYIIKLTKEEKC